jgi:hypothetical protein
MRKLVIATLLLMLGVGTAAADRYRGGRGGRDRGDRVYRDRGNDRTVNRSYNHHDNRNRGVGVDRGWNNRVVRRPVYVNDNRYHFHGGHSVTHHRPIVNVRYTDYRYRPTLLVENYETVPGYTWMAGSWQWNGYEWNWVNGHYDVDSAYYPDSDYSYAPVSSYSDCD